MRGIDVFWPVRAPACGQESAVSRASDALDCAPTRAWAWSAKSSIKPNAPQPWWDISPSATFGYPLLQLPHHSQTRNRSLVDSPAARLPSATTATNQRRLPPPRRTRSGKGSIFPNTVDSEISLHLLAKPRRWRPAFNHSKTSVRRIQGAYSSSSWAEDD